MWRNDTKCKYMFMIPPKNLARKGLYNQELETMLGSVSLTNFIQLFHFDLIFASVTTAKLSCHVQYCSNNCCRTRIKCAISYYSNLYYDGEILTEFASNVWLGFGWKSHRKRSETSGFCLNHCDRLTPHSSGPIMA